MAINHLSSAASLSLADFLAISSYSLGVDAKLPISALVDFLRDALGEEGGEITQYAAPAATGFSVLLAPTDPGRSVYLQLTPVAAYAAGTLVLPEVTTATDGQKISVNTTQAVTALTVDGSGASVNGAPTTLAQFAFFVLRFDGITKTWKRVG